MADSYIDRPKPGRGYVGLNVGMVVFTAVICAVVLITIDKLMALAIVIAVVGVNLPGIIIMAGMLHAAYRTEYRVSDGALDLRCGWIMHRVIPVAEIQSVERVTWIPRVVGWGLGKASGYCNRLTNGLLLKVDHGSVYVSPGDMEGFCAALGKVAEVSPVQERRNRRAVLLAGLFLLVIFALALALALIHLPARWERAFVDDEAVVGRWETVDFVGEVEDFQPGQRWWKEELYLGGLTFEHGGRTSQVWRWSKGYTWNPDNRAEGRYVVKEIDGTSYLFMEWINGDVLIRHEKPKYYVMKRVG